MDPDYLQRYYRFRDAKWVGPWYYEYPDGEDLLGKLSFCGQISFILSGPIGILNAYAKSPIPTSQAGRFLRVFRAIGPGVGMGLAFAATTYYATRYRQKDDFVNHALGGAAAGIIFGAVNGFDKGLSASLILAAFAAALKGSREINDIPLANRNFSAYFRRSMDLSGGRFNSEGSWVKAPAPEN